MLTLIVFLVLTPLFTGIPTGFLLVKLLKKQDIRKTGSGNIGATNVRRLLGTGWSLVVLFLDALKGALPVLLMLKLNLGHALGGWQIFAAGILSILGNIFSPWLGFRGGKGIATSLGVALAIVPGPLGISAACFLIVAVLSNYISLSSLVSAFLLPVNVLIFARLGKTSVEIPRLMFTIALALIVLWTHHENIRRLARGEENTIIKSKKNR